MIRRVGVPAKAKLLAMPRPSNSAIPRVVTGVARQEAQRGSLVLAGALVSMPRHSELLRCFRALLESPVARTALGAPDRGCSS